jgi:hypothetical protein
MNPGQSYESSEFGLAEARAELQWLKAEYPDSGRIPILEQRVAALAQARRRRDVLGRRYSPSRIEFVRRVGWLKRWHREETTLEPMGYDDFMDGPELIRG